MTIPDRIAHSPGQAARHRTILALGICLSALGLTGCGGGGSGGAGSTPVVVPAPGPSPSPAPAPQPSISYASFDELTGSREFHSGCGNLFGTGNTSTEGFSTFPANPETLGHWYDAASDSWQVRGYARDHDGGPEYAYEFGPSDLDPSSDDMTRRYGFIDTNGSPVVFSIISRSIGIAATEFVRETRLVAKPGVNKIDIHCVIGVPTVQADPLPAGQYSYADLAIAGTARSATTEYDLRESTASWAIDGGKLQSRLVLKLVGRAVTASGLSATRTDLGTYTTPYALLQLPHKFFSGVLFKGGDAAGAFGGSFFGPRGEEIGMGFSGSAAASGIDFQFGGTVVGIR